MPYLRKFKHLLEKKRGEIDQPDGAWITWAVCACGEDACSWEGWILEDVFKGEKPNKVHLPARDDQVCPNCGRDLYRTEAYKFHLAEDQTHDLVPGVDYEVGEIEYED